MTRLGQPPDGFSASGGYALDTVSPWYDRETAMILTGPEIQDRRASGELVIEPFDPRQLNPNSYNYRLGSPLVCIIADDNGDTHQETLTIPDEGFVLQPRRVYLGCTHEVIGSASYVMTLLGRSSVGRLGLYLNISADLGHCGAVSRWTLELTVVQPLRIYPLMLVGQVAFWPQQGEAQPYNGRYHGDDRPVRSRDERLLGIVQ